jgi:hypothetical protein
MYEIESIFFNHAVLWCTVNKTLSYSFSFTPSTVRIWRWHLLTAEMIGKCENGVELCTYTELHTQISTHMCNLHTQLWHNIKLSPATAALAPMWNLITLSYLCGPVESSKDVSFLHSAVQSSDVTIKVPLRHPLAGLRTGTKPNTTDNFHVPMVTSTAHSTNAAFCPHIIWFAWCSRRGTNSTYTGWSKRLCAPDDYGTKNTKKYFKHFQPLTMIT